ncbi:MAG: trypsin-like serine protease [Proteobacteria bacterium]|nr:trypsin-like serine protease [Pseudomonadota bacterium]
MKRGSLAIVCVLTSVAAGEVTDPAATILGGTKTKVGDYKTVVMLEVGQGLCTGTLISPTFVLTAGHCIDPTIVGATSEAALVSAMKVHFDTVDVGLSSGTVVRAKRVIHAGFDANNVGQHDVGLVELATPVTDREPSRVNLVAAAAPAAGTVATMVGFGQTLSGGAGVEYVVTNRVSGKCADVVPPTSGLPTPQDANLLCFSQTDSKGKCHGDSGGPSFESIDGVPFVVGVTSFGDQTCEVFGADTRTDIEATFLTTNVPDLCAAADCGSDAGCCDTRGRGGPTSLLAIGLVGFALRRKRR